MRRQQTKKQVKSFFLLRKHAKRAEALASSIAKLDSTEAANAAEFEAVFAALEAQYSTP